jgi:hypothetical protein
MKNTENYKYMWKFCFIGEEEERFDSSNYPLIFFPFPLIIYSEMK